VTSKLFHAIFAISLITADILFLLT